MNKSLTILFVDDDKKRTRILINYFEIFEKWTIIPATSFKEGVEKYEKYKDNIQIILLDVMMSVDKSMTDIEIERSNKGLNTGLLFAERLENMGNKSPIILITALGDLDNYIGKYGIKYILRKPVNIDILLETIKENIK